ncbi:acyltransferase family protein [Nocardioides baculatus]|uniref:Acyltransferase n=1 Tax=Nocardioides baculatus TaxID=2801337 RepID=A0ABS1LBQ3_9ACTN|nr:acyltransferase [Nocardioides baculatus]MBL0749126.1 acyltransferase [Nocardioides baculatus]
MIKRMSRGSRHLPSLTSLRFFAAMLVVAYHAAHQSTPADGHAFASLRFGYLGVTFFFVLSGFVMVWSARDGSAAASYYRRRFARVWPVHALTLVAAATLVAAGVLESRTGLGTTTANALLLQAWTMELSVAYSYNSVAWSLSAEAFFYAVFPLLYLVFRRQAPTLAIAVGVGWLVLGGLLAEALATPTATYALTYTFSAYRVGEFLIGMGIALLVRTNDSSGIRPFLAVAFAAVSYAGLIVVDRLSAGTLGDHLWVVSLMFIPAVALMLVVFARRDLNGDEGWLSSPALVRLGRWSFALYMVHELVLRVARPFMLGRPWTAVIFVACAIALSGAVYRLVEQPIERRMRGSRKPAAQLDNIPA